MTVVRSAERDDGQHESGHRPEYQHLTPQGDRHASGLRPRYEQLTGRAPDPRLVARATPDRYGADATREAWGRFLRGFHWDHFATLTYRAPVAVGRAERDVWMGWIRRLERIAQRRVSYFYVVEPTVSGWPHVHALVAGTADLRIDQLEGTWRAGYRRIVRYDPARGASWYVSKDLLDRALTWDVSKRLVTRVIERKGYP
jgi:hypothetical protein